MQTIAQSDIFRKLLTMDHALAAADIVNRGVSVSRRLQGLLALHEAGYTVVTMADSYFVYINGYSASWEILTDCGKPGAVIADILAAEDIPPRVCDACGTNEAELDDGYFLCFDCRDVLSRCTA